MIDTVGNHTTAEAFREELAHAFAHPTYPLRGDEVEVLSIAHGRRRPGHWR
jgi:hypothetical protein